LKHVLDKRIRLCLARLELLSYGAVANLNASGGKAKPTGGDKPGGWRGFEDVDEREVPHLRFRQAYEACETNPEREGVCEAAEATLKALTEPRRVEAKGESLEALKARILKDGQGWSVKDSAIHFRVTETFIRKTRAEGGRHIETGDPIKALTVEQMVVKGWSVRQVAAYTGWSVMTAQRRMAKAKESAA
jgi:hypothetical protein